MDRRLNPVAWTEGMFLRPHHFQQHELSIQGRLDYHLRAADPFHWGVREFALNEEALAARRIEILRLDAVLPGGTIVRYPGNAIVSQREFPATARSVDVHVGVRRLSPMHPNSSPLDSANGSDEALRVRYIARSESLPDLARGGFEVPIPLLLPNVRVFLGDEQEELEEYESLRLCRIEATGQSKRPFAQSATVSPPLLSVQAFPPLEADVRRIVAQIGQRMTVVANRTELIAMGELPRLWMRYTLARMTPVLTHLLDVGETRPFALYTALIETAGALSAFRTREPAKLPRYDHLDPWPRFHELLEFIDAQLEDAAPTFTELKMPYDPTHRAYVTNALTVPLADPRNRFTLGLRAKMESAKLTEFVTKYGKAGSRKWIRLVVDSHTPGLTLERLAGEPTDIAGPPGSVYFKLEPYEAHWSEVTKEFSLALALAEHTDVEVSLYIVTPRT